MPEGATLVQQGLIRFHGSFAQTRCGSLSQLRFLERVFWNRGGQRMSNRAFQVRWPLLQAGPTGGSLAFDRAMLKPPGDDSAGPAVESEPLENAIGNVAPCNELDVSRLPRAIASWMVARFLQGCATDAVAMCGIPLEWDGPSAHHGYAKRPSPERADPSSVRS